VALPDVKGRIDHFAADPDGRRLYVSALGNDTLEVIDVSASPPKRVSTVSGLRKPAGVAFLPGLDRVAAASGDDGMCRVLDAGTLKLAGVVRDLDDADHV